MSISLRPLEIEDAGPAQLYASDQRLAATCNIPHPYPPEEGIKFVSSRIQGRKADRRFPYAIVFEDQFVGFVGAALLKKEEIRLEGWIAVPWWGRGFATNAMSLFAQIAFVELNLEELSSVVWSGNAASIRVHQKCRFQETETCLNDGRYGVKFKGELYRRFSLKKADWKSFQAFDSNHFQHCI